MNAELLVGFVIQILNSWAVGFLCIAWGFVLILRPIIEDYRAGREHELRIQHLKSYHPEQHLKQQEQLANRSFADQQRAALTGVGALGGMFGSLLGEAFAKEAPAYSYSMQSTERKPMQSAGAQIRQASPVSPVFAGIDHALAQQAQIEKLLTALAEKLGPVLPSAVEVNPADSTRGPEPIRSEVRIRLDVLALGQDRVIQLLHRLIEEVEV